MSRLLAADITGIDDSTARGALDAAWESVPPHGRVELLPWIGWGEADYAAATGRPVAAAPLRELRDLLDAARLDSVTLVKAGDSDLAGGFVFDERDADQATAITALGFKTKVLNTLMRDTDVATALAAATLELAESLQ